MEASMRALLQRVSRASVTVEEQIVGQIDQGLLVLLGIGQGDGEPEVKTLVDKIVQLRIFGDEEGKMNRSLLDIQGEILVVSQFTLYGDCRKGRRPSFDGAGPPELARTLYEYFVARARERNSIVSTGEFQAYMAVELVNDGPVTILLDSSKLF